ncbi:MAG: hypothetical protein ACFE8P_04820 [Promethearchaeota archaeon]
MVVGVRFKDHLDQDYILKISKELGVFKEYKLLSSGVEDPDDYFEKLGKI